jgi:hypothetical protein
VTGKATWPVSDEQVAEWLLALNGEAFRKVVADDVHGRAAADVADGLRCPSVLPRWGDELRLLRVDAQAQLSARRVDNDTEWRGRIIRWMERIDSRRAEAKNLAYLQRRRGGNGTGAGRVQQETPLSNRTRRRAAGERARDRLVERHLEEFRSILNEELVADGLPVRVRDEAVDQS